MIKKILKGLTYVLVGLLVVLNVAILAMKISGKEVNIFGYHIYYIASGSMEPTIKTGEVIVGKEEGIEDLEIEDIVTFYGTKGSLAGKIITHRIIDKYEEDGETYIVTKGDATGNIDEAIPASDVISVYKFTIPLVGYLVRLISSKLGFLLVIIIPFSVLLIKQVINLSHAIKEEDDEEESEDTEEQNENKE